VFAEERDHRLGHGVRLFREDHVARVRDVRDANPISELIAERVAEVRL
jgi:hypothetical protein